MRPKFALKLGIKKVIIKLDLHFACCDKAVKLELTKWKDSSLLNRCLISLPLREGGGGRLVLLFSYTCVNRN